MARFIRGPFGIGVVLPDSICMVSGVYQEIGHRCSQPYHEKQEYDFACIEILFLSGKKQGYRERVNYPIYPGEDYAKSLVERSQIWQQAKIAAEAALEEFLNKLNSVC